MFLLLARGLILLGALASLPGSSAQERRAESTSEGSADLSAAALVGETQEDVQQQENVQEGAIPGAEKPQLESLFQGALVGVEDAQDFVETPGYRQLLETLSRYGDEELRRKAGRRLDVALALADPDDWRGEIVLVRALVAGQMAVRLSRPLGEHVDAFRAFLTEADGSEGVVVDFLGLPPPFALQEDVVEVEGVFFRTVRYENRKGAFVEAPYLIARGIRRLDTEALPRSTELNSLWPKLMIGAAVAFFVVRILFSMRKKQVAPAAALAARTLRERARVARAPTKPSPPAHKS